MYAYGNTGRRGDRVWLQGLLRTTNDYTMLVGREVEFRVDGTLVGSAVTGDNGWALHLWTVPPATFPGRHLLKASFSGDAWYEAASDSRTFDVIP
jgi:hypothetical protein